MPSRTVCGLSNQIVVLLSESETTKEEWKEALEVSLRCVERALAMRQCPHCKSVHDQRVACPAYARMVVHPATDGGEE